MIPHKKEVNLDVADDDDDEWYEEDLAVKANVVEISPLLWPKASQGENGGVSRPWLRGGDTLPVVIGGALVEIFHWVLHHSEDDGLWGGEHNGQHPGRGHHQPEALLKVLAIFGSPYLALLLCLAVFREDKGLEMLMYL
jgi:hypothetical protein